MAHVVIRFARNAGIVALFVVAATLGILSGVLFAYSGDLPQISALDNYAPSTTTRDVFQLVKDRMAGRPSRPAGASTLTQQLARNVLPETVGFERGDTSPE